jgi:hypothetical protein
MRDDLASEHLTDLLGPWVTNPTREIDAAFATFLRERADVLSVGATSLQQPPLPSQAGGVSFLAGTKSATGAILRGLSPTAGEHLQRHPRQ